MRDTKTLIAGLKDLSIELDNNQINQLLTYYDLLIEKNKVMNLTSITDYEEVIHKHFIDSLSLIRVCNLKEPLSIMDLGTGAGFPGIPLKIAFPKLKVVLLDSLNKRIMFLNEVIQSLDLLDIKAIHGRAEDCGKNVEYREQFDLCVSRAVANLATLSEYCIPFVKEGGMFIPYKSGNIKEELDNSTNAIKILGGDLAGVDTFQIPSTEIERSFVIIKKIKSTLPIYPRNAGKPNKAPLT